MLARLAAEVRDALARPDSGVTVAGRPLEEVTDPFAAGGAPAGAARGPAARAAGAAGVRAARARRGAGRGGAGGGGGPQRDRGAGGRVLDGQDPGLLGGAAAAAGPARAWRLWHPIDPSRPDAALRELPGIGPRTVVWLNEAQFYLDVADGGLGERVAAGLRELLRDPARAPVLVLATLWPQFWDALTARPAGGADPHAQARELLAGHDITVPAAFTAAQLQQLSEAGDARLAQAAAGAQDGQVIQFLAGAPELLARYRNAPPAATALIHAAMDARRLGMGIGLPQAFLEAAAPGYLTDTEWDALGEDWLEQALAYTAVPCKGVRGPLTRIRPRPARSRAPGPGSRDSDEQLAGGRPASRTCRCTGSRTTWTSTADRTGRARSPRQTSGPQRPTTPSPATRPRSVTPPTPAACTVTPPSSTRTPPPAATSALFSTSATLRTTSALTSAPCAGPPPTSPSTTRTPWPGCWTACGRRARRSRPPRCCAVIPPPTSPSTTRAPWPGCWTACGRRARRSRPPRWPTAIRRPRLPRRPGRRGQAAGQAAGGGRAGAGHRAGRPRSAAHVPLDDPDAVAACWTACGRRARRTRPPRCWPRSAAHVPLDDPGAVAGLLDSLREAGAQDQATALADRAAAHVPLDDPGAVASLLDSLREAGAQEQAAALADRAAAHVPLDDPDAVAGCWTACGRRARRTRPPRCWPRSRRPRPPRRPGRRGQPAGQPAGGGRAGPGRRAAGPRSRRPRPPRRPGRRGRAAGQPAGGGRAGAGRRAAGP